MAKFSQVKLPNGNIYDIAARYDADGNDIKETYAKKSDTPGGGGGDADTVNGHTVESDVPANAVFTDTTYDAATAAPKMDGTATVGTSEKYAREDHIHPSDTSKVSTSRKINGKALSNDISLTASDVGAVPTSRKVNGYSLSSDVTLSASDVSAIPLSQKGAASGVAELDSTGKVPSSQLPSYVDDVIERDSRNDFPLTGETGKIYVDKRTNKTYRWSGSDYIVIGSSLALGETDSTAYRGDRGAAAYAHASAKGSAFSSGLYKITTNAEGHVTAASAVAKTDITALGVPAQDTTYDPASESPLMDGTAAVGISEKYAREDHVHPSDTTRVPVTRTVNGKALSTDISLTASDVSAIPASQKGVASGVAELDSTGKVPSAQLPAISSLELGETSSTAYRGDRGAQAYAHAVTNKGSEFTSGFYKIGTNSEGHVTSATAVEKSDITALGIPGSLVGTAYEYDDTSLTLEFNEETEFDTSFSPISDLEIDQIMGN